MFYTIGLLLIFSIILLVFDHKSRYSWLFVMMSIGAMIAFFFIILHINMFASYGSYYSRSIYYRLDYLVFDTITNTVKIPLVTNIRMMNFGIFLYLLAVTIFNFDFNKDLLRAKEREKDKKSWNAKLLLFLIPVLSVLLSDPVISTKMYIAYHTSSSPEWNDFVYRTIEIGYKFFVLILLLRPIYILFKYVVKTKIYFLRLRISLFAAGLLLANGIFYFFFYVGTFSISVDKVILSGFWVFGNIEAKIPIEYLAGSPIIFIIISVCIFVLLSFNMDTSATLFAQKKIQRNVAIMNEVLGETLHSQKNLFFSMQILAGKIRKKTDGVIEIPEIDRMEKLVSDSLKRTAEMLDGLKEVKYHYLNNSILDIIDDAVNEVTMPENIELEWEKTIYQDSKNFYGMYDRYHLEKALVNILKNSVEAIEISGKTNGKITISLSFLLRWLIIEIEDNGTGLKPREKKHIFSPHYSGKQGKMNWGLGLPYVYKVIKAHLGQTKIYSKYGKFTSVLIMLPTGKDKKQKPEGSFRGKKPWM